MSTALVTWAAYRGDSVGSRRCSCMPVGTTSSETCCSWPSLAKTSKMRSGGSDTCSSTSVGVRRGDDANWNDSALRHSVRRPDTNPRRQRRDRGRARRVFRALSQVTCPHGRLVVPGQNPGVALPRRLVSLPILRGQQITGSSHRQRRQRCRVLRPRRRFRLRYVAARVLVAIGPRTLNHGVAVQRG